MSVKDRYEHERYLLEKYFNMTAEILNARMHRAGYGTYNLTHARRAIARRLSQRINAAKLEQRKAQPNKTETIERLLKTTILSYAAIARSVKSTYPTVAGIASKLRKKEPNALLHRKGLKHATQRRHRVKPNHRRTRQGSTM